MKQNILLFSTAALLLSLASCQQQPTTQAATTTPAEVTAVAAVPVPISTVDTTQTAAQPLTLEMREFLKKHNLGYLLELDIERPESQNGFYGSDHYRIEFVFLQVQQDAHQPNVYYVKGKNRYKKVITSIEGTIVFDQIVDQLKQAIRENKRLQIEVANLYSASGKFRLEEAGNTKLKGVFTGDVGIDFTVSDKGDLCFFPTRGGVTQGGGIKFEGVWTSNATGQQKEVVWVNDISTYGNNVLKNFNVGERSLSVNPKYAKLGWDTYWENDEWWAEPGPATARAVAPDSL